MNKHLGRKPLITATAWLKEPDQRTALEKFWLNFCDPRFTLEQARLMIDPPPGRTLTVNQISRFIIDFEVQLILGLESEAERDYLDKLEKLQHSRLHEKYTGFDVVRLMVFFYARFVGAPMPVYSENDPDDPLSDYIIEKYYPTKLAGKRSGCEIFYASRVVDEDLGPKYGVTYKYVFSAEPPKGGRSYSVIHIGEIVDDYVKQHGVD